MTKLKFFGFIILVFSIFSGCRKDKITTDPSARLSFSKDLIQFDTVFTDVGSATHNFKVKNPNKNAVVISSIRLGYGSLSYYRINVSGQTASRDKGMELKDIQLEGGDSMYIFVEVTIDPKDKDLPFIVTDSILFNTNGNTQFVKLEARGQDAYLLQNVILNSSGILPVNRPLLFRDQVIIDKDVTVTIPAGANIYCHSGAILDVRGTLIIEGEKDKPVVFHGDRLERYYGKYPGQWGGILFRKSSKGNSINHCILQNATFGIYDSFYTGIATGAAKLKIHNSIIRNMYSYGIVGLNTHIEADNLLVYNCGRLLFICDNGGTYKFRHCTFDNTNSAFVRQFPSVAFQNGKIENVIPPMEIVFLNNIVSGTEDEEFQLSKEDNTTNWADSIFNNYIRTKGDFNGSNILSKVTDTKKIDPGYINSGIENFHLQTNPLSAVIDKGLGPIVTGISKDLEENPRDTSPDLGCYEHH